MKAWTEREILLRGWFSLVQVLGFRWGNTNKHELRWYLDGNECTGPTMNKSWQVGNEMRTVCLKMSGYVLFICPCAFVFVVDRTLSASSVPNLSESSYFQPSDNLHSRFQILSILCRWSEAAWNASWWASTAPTDHLTTALTSQTNFELVANFHEPLNSLASESGSNVIDSDARRIKFLSHR